MRWGFWAFIAVLVVLHFVLRIGLGYAQLAPDLLVVALLLGSREMRAGWAAGLGLLLGILDGSVVPFSLGASAVALTIVGYFGARSRELFASDNYFLLALYLFAGKWLYDTLLLFVTGGVFEGSASYLLTISPIAALYAAAAGLVCTAAYRAFT